MLVQWVLFSTFCIGAQSVSTVTLSTPGAHAAGEELILDCDFEFEEQEASQLDLKWYFNGSPVPIYQWVPALDLGPQVIDPMFKDNLDLKYQAHSEKLKKHRALHIMNPDERFSGHYKCKVSSFVDEASAENEVIVYVPPSQVVLNALRKTDNEPTNISCHASGIFPLPLVTLVWTENSTILTSDDVEYQPNPVNPGLFDVSITVDIDPFDVVQQDMISCEITIPDTEFSVRMETEIFEKPESTQEPEVQLEIDVFSGSASGSEEEDLCESSGDADCGSGYPTDYEVVDENFSKVGVDRGMQEEADLIEPSSSPHICANMVAILLILYHILLLSI
eukprot:TRINITY_DN18352_c0_g1_i1.p1 TRINITY_DN18352_c0_g1~~TRINITY_DN18352_c0_g1_i1.p1  ORF type:complete len:335 (+),score=68.76 TRINITY_DN18352_c0_g1_i1:68-1072(+)